MVSMVVLRCSGRFRAFLGGAAARCSKWLLGS